jgi:hypothetical protein
MIMGGFGAKFGAKFQVLVPKQVELRPLVADFGSSDPQKTPRTSRFLFDPANIANSLKSLPPRHSCTSPASPQMYHKYT